LGLEVERDSFSEAVEVTTVNVIRDSHGEFEELDVEDVLEGDVVKVV
jgi:magnesium-transporting ATPase (P-type)